MIQLSYQPAFDPYHTMYRLIRILVALGDTTSLLVDHIRILDFYFLFPFEIAHIRLTPQHRRFRSTAQTYEERRPYGNQPEDVLIFDRMKPMQLAALDTLATKGIIDPEAWQRGMVIRTKVPIPVDLCARVNNANAADSQLMEMIVALATEYSLLGRDGLKARTGLLEHRYDAA
ncbi:hypothetical protein FXB40_32190 [Bradyrhizobium rifense]|uniref:Uncharacterized protein n=1 Tax=Bradyrhizobium rifense TaxID=515499 RepID=A0A5D3K6H9_9BRAD|nr:ABC-three component system middle component 5 [Bradyrhizobium rifense]TYL90748.1 hypothetical protein FXB40_32190 [Bradyrhizobium rifense]